MIGLALSFAVALGPTHTLALTLVAEAEYAETDHAAILHVLDRRAARGGETPAQHAMRYSSFWRRPETPARVLRRIRKNPEKWRATLERVRRFERGELPDPCRGRALHWGDREGDLARAKRAGWARVSCGNTANLFWSIDGGR